MILTRLKTLDHSSFISLLNSVTDGYQGESERFKNHLQSLATGSKIQVGFPNAPDKCAIEESIVITRSNLLIAVAVSQKSSKR